MASVSFGRVLAILVVMASIGSMIFTMHREYECYSPSIEHTISDPALSISSTAPTPETHSEPSPIQQPTRDFLPEIMGDEERFPEGKRLLIVVASFGHAHVSMATTLLLSFVDLCEFGLDIVEVVIDGTGAYDQGYIADRFHCIRTGKPLNIHTRTFPHEIGKSLTAQHQSYVMDNIDRWDWVLYLEDDLDFRPAMYALFMKHWNIIKSYNLTHTYLPRFIRIDICNLDNVEPFERIRVTDVVEIHLKDYYRENYFPDKHKYYVAPHALGSVKELNGTLWWSPSQPYTAFYLLPKTHIKFLNDSGVYVMPYQTQEFHSSFFRDRYYTGVIPIDQVGRFYLHHLADRYSCAFFAGENRIAAMPATYYHTLIEEAKATHIQKKREEQEKEKKEKEEREKKEREEREEKEKKEREEQEAKAREQINTPP